MHPFVLFAALLAGSNSKFIDGIKIAPSHYASTAKENLVGRVAPRAPPWSGNERRARSDVPYLRNCLVIGISLELGAWMLELSLFLHALNPRAEFFQFFIHLFVAAIQMINAVHLRRAFRRESRDNQRRARA